MSTTVELLRHLQSLVEEKNPDALEKWKESYRKTLPDLCMPEIDTFINGILSLTKTNISEQKINEIYSMAMEDLIQHAKLIRFFHALFPGEESIPEYIRTFHNLIDNLQNSDCVSFCNAMLVQYGMCAIPDIMVAAHKHRSTKLHNTVASQLDSIWRITVPNFQTLQEGKEEELFQKLCYGYLREAFSSYPVMPVFLTEMTDIHFDKKVQKDIQSIMEAYPGDDEESVAMLESTLQKYNEKQIVIVGAGNILKHILHEGALSMDSYLYCADMFESIGDLCDQDEKYLALCEASYRATGNLPKYIDNSYNLREKSELDSSEKKRSDDWINEPNKDDDFRSKRKDDDADPPLREKKDEKRDNTGAQTIYNITYQNSFNKNRKRTINDSYNNSRIDSDDIDNSVHGGIDSDNYSGRKYKGKGEVMVAWKERNKTQRKLQETYKKKAPLTAPPDDLKTNYLQAVQWNEENLKKTEPWVILFDTEKNRPSADISYRKYLVRKIESLADDRDIDYDGNIVVAGDPVDGIYDIELTQYNDVAVVDALRKVANAVLQQEIKHLQNKPKSKNETIDATISFFNELDLMEEEILGGDPEKDRPFGQRVQNSVNNFNSKAQNTINSVDRGLRSVGNTAYAVAQTPMQLVSTVKNFISDMKNRKEQAIKEDILHNKKTRMTIFDMTRSLVKTVLPWAILGPLWGTLWNIVALPVRAVKGTWNAIRGGPHRDLMIEMREELRTEMDIIQDRINSSSTSQIEKHNLARQLNRMQQEYYKIASKVHFDPTAEKRRRQYGLY